MVQRVEVQSSHTLTEQLAALERGVLNSDCANRCRIVAHGIHPAQ